MEKWWASNREPQRLPAPLIGATNFFARYTMGSGGGEIRTHETFRPSGFQDRRDQPLCHPSGVGYWQSEIHYPFSSLLKVK
jgi:hypothetical protein